MLRIIKMFCLFIERVTVGTATYEITMNGNCTYFIYFSHFPWNLGIHVVCMRILAGGRTNRFLCLNVLLVPRELGLAIAITQVFLIYV